MVKKEVMEIAEQGGSVDTRKDYDEKSSKKEDMLTVFCGM